MSPRLYPFTFFPEVRDVLGTPHRLNAEARAASPTLIDNPIATVNDNLPGSGDIVRYTPQPPIPARTPADPFARHVALGRHHRDTTTLPPPISAAHGVDITLSVLALALTQRPPSTVTAALFIH